MSFLDVLSYLLLPSSTSLNVNLQNLAGNTPLHWASLNGHLDAVKALIGAGADPAIRNGTGHDAVYEAEVGGKDEVVSWLLKEGEGLEKGVVGDHVKEERDGEDADKESAADGVERVAEGADGADGAQRAVEEAEKGLTDLRFKEQN